MEPLIMITEPYLKFSKDVKQVLPEENVITNYSKRFAYGVDASFYRLIPQIVLLIDSEDELISTIKLARAANIAMTFRAAGTSLSGQAQSDSILIMLTNSWRHHEILELGLKIKLGPAVIGADANKYLLPYGRKIGPDPASIDTCKIAGIAANNASGMCCGVSQNSYHTMESIRVILNNGSIFDNSSCELVAQFRKSHSKLLNRLDQLAKSTKNNSALKELIEHKYRLKNTTGYAINSLIDFDDPIDILAHLIIGSEGTLGFISSITYHTVIEHKYRASSLILFPNLEVTCQVVTKLANEKVEAVELLDYRSLKSVSKMKGLPNFILDVEEGCAALLIETRTNNQEALNNQIEQLTRVLATFEQVDAIKFTDKPEQYNLLWAIRKQTFPAVGAVRENGTTVIIEDVAFPVERLASAVTDLQLLFDKYHYNEAIIFGHALEGNLHFVFTQDFSKTGETSRYKSFMEDVCQLVAIDYQGSLKAEHGTGRNMAPFIEMEWGEQGYQLMQKIKTLFDPDSLLNPGVIINHDPNAHIQHLKTLPTAHPIIDKCIECGFCEPVCPSHGLSFTPRQRITMFREITRLKKQNVNSKHIKKIERDFNYLGIDTCAATGLCEQKCPVGINTGDLIRELRGQKNSHLAFIANLLAKKFSSVEKLTRFGLASIALSQKILGKVLITKIFDVLNRVSAGGIPVLHGKLPNRVKHFPRLHINKIKIERPKVVYFPSCASRNMGPSIMDKDQRPLTEVTLSLLTKAGFEVINPDFSGQCCGMPFKSKGMFEQAESKRDDLHSQLKTLSQNGKYPVLFDTSPCKSMLFDEREDIFDLKVYEPVAFITDVLSEYLSFKVLDETIMLHVTCSSRRMGLNDKMIALAKRCANKVIVPEHIYCCGFAGDKGFTTPELNANALATLKSQVPTNCLSGYSNSRTCEIGLSEHAGVDYRSIIYLVDKASQKINHIR